MDNIEFRPEVVDDDLSGLPANIRERIIRAIEKRLAADPVRYGVRLAKSLKGLWKLRCGDYRVVYEIKGGFVTIWVIAHRKSVYAEAERRWMGE